MAPQRGGWAYFDISLEKEVKWLLKEGGGLIFECFDISLESTPTLHVVYISTPTTNHLSTISALIKAPLQ